MADIEVTISGTTVTVTPADRIVIRLAENATAGYQWSVTEAGEGLDVESSELWPAGSPGPGGPAPGAGGQRVVRIRPRGPGRARVRLQLERAWEPEPVDRFDLDVIVAAD
jgi:predicted secreted protein